MKQVLLIIIVLFIHSGCSSDRVKPPIDSSYGTEELPSQESWNSTVFFSDSGKIKATLKAGHLKMFAETKQTLLDSNIQVDFYDDNQVVTTVLTAKRGKVDETTNNLWAIDSVVTKSDSVTIQTEEMMWRNKDKKIVSDKFVTVISPTEKIQGYGFESDQGLKNYVIYNITYVTRTDNKE